MSAEQKDLIDTERLTNTDQNLDKQQDEEPVVDDVKFGSDKEEVENISTEILPSEPQKPNAKKILAKSKEELEEELKVSIDREKYLKDTKDEMFKSFEKKGNVYFLEGKTAIKVENYTLGFNKGGVKNTSCSPHSSPLVFAKSLSDVKVKHISNFPIVEGSLENLEQAFLLIQEKDLFDLNEITIGKDVDDSVKEMLERLKTKNNVELGVGQDNKQGQTATNDDVKFGDNKQESTQSLEDKKEDETKPSTELTDDDIANFGDYGSYTLDEALESDPELEKHIETNTKQFDKDNLDDLDLDSDVSKNKHSRNPVITEKALDFDEEQLEADSVLDFDKDEPELDNDIDFDEYSPEKPSLKPESKPEKPTVLSSLESEKSDLLNDLKSECHVEKPEPKSANTNKNTKTNRISNKP